MKSYRAGSKSGLAISLWLLCIAGAAGTLHADTLTVTGIINQSTQDGTGPAVNNPDLNQIVDGSFYIVRLNFAGSLAGPGTYDLTGSNLFFRVETAGASETAFNSVSLTIAQSGGLDVLSLFACLSTGSGCGQGNELDLNFQIPAGSLNSISAQPLAVPGLLPLDLLEDDGVTDIHASIDSYSYRPASPSPEPSPLVIVAAGAIVTALAAIWRRAGKGVRR